jgi:hypothetical protein
LAVLTEYNSTMSRPAAASDSITHWGASVGTSLVTCKPAASNNDQHFAVRRHGAPTVVQDSDRLLACAAVTRETCSAVAHTMGPAFYGVAREEFG